VELVRKAFEAYRTGGIEALLPFYAPDIVWFPAREWPEDSSYRGHDGIRRQDALWAGTFEASGWEVHEIRDLQGQVLVLTEMTARTKDSSVSVRQRVGLVVAGFRDGTITEVRSFSSWQEALEAVGLSE
jgi:ketosteroid isomerase-like protein